MKELKLIALDIGAGSGRSFLASYNGNSIKLSEISRFENPQYMLGNTLYWDFLTIMADVKESIARCSQTAGHNIHSIAIDTWGADFGLIDRKGSLLSNPVTYRDKRTDDIDRLVYTKIPEKKLYRLNNSVTYGYCTLFQLYYLARFNRDLLKITDKYLPISCLINYFLTGQKFVEPSVLSGSQLYDIKKREYLYDILDKLRIPVSILPEVIEAGTVLGDIKPAYFPNQGSRKIPKVVLVCGHDSASASAGIPLRPGRQDECYINSGTWSLIGIESDDVMVSDKAFQYGFTSWRAFRENILSAKIFNGFYFIQQFRKIWDKGKKVIESYDDFYKILDYGYESDSLMDLDSDEIIGGKYDMLKNLSEYFKSTGQPSLSSVKEITSCVLQSMILEYSLSINQIEELHGRKINNVYMVGGGSKNKIFCQWLADCLKKDVFTGYPESTINGNVIAQLIALKEIKDLETGRDIIRNSTKEKVYKPSKTTSIDWDSRMDMYVSLKKRNYQKGD